jgi:hypothetical protein
LLEIHAAGLALTARSRSDHKIVRAPREWIDQLIHELRAIAAVAIEKYNDIALW